MVADTFFELFLRNFSCKSIEKTGTFFSIHNIPHFRLTILSFILQSICIVRMYLDRKIFLCINKFDQNRELLGPWSDIYSVGASMYACLSGSAPQAADDRQKNDRLVPAMVRWEGKYSDRLLEIIDWCMSLNHLYRPQSVFSLQKALVAEVHPPNVRKEGWMGRFVNRFRTSAR